MCTFFCTFAPRIMLLKTAITFFDNETNHHNPDNIPMLRSSRSCTGAGTYSRSRDMDL